MPPTVVISSVTPPPRRSVKQLIIKIAIGVVILAAAVGLGIWVAGMANHAAIEAAVRDEVIAQNKLMKGSEQNGVYPNTVPEGVGSTETVIITVIVPESGTDYCLAGSSAKDASIVFHMTAATNEEEPEKSSCADGATVPPTVPGDVSVASVSTDRIVLQWKASLYAASYDIECSPRSDFTSGLVETSVSASPAAVEGLAGGAVYYCRVAGVNAQGQSLWSNTVSAETLPVSVVPANLVVTTISTSELAYSWDPVPGAIEYVLEYSTDSNFVNDVTKVKTTATSGRAKGLQTYTGYFFHVKAVTASFNESQAAFSEIVQGRTAE